MAAGIRSNAVLRFQHHHVELAVARLVVVRDRDIELDFAEVHQQHPEAFALHLPAVQGERELRLLRHGVGNRRLQVCHGA